MSISAIFSQPLLVQVLGGVIIAVILFLVDRGGRMVAQTLHEREDEEERERKAYHALSVWAWGLPATEDRPPVKGFVKDTWPDFIQRFDRMETTVNDQLRRNGGSSLADQVAKILEHLENGK